MKKIVLIIVAIVTMLFTFTAFTGCAEEGIVVGYDNKFAPMGYQDDKGKDVGFDIDVAKEMESYLGKKIILRAITWSSKEIELKAKSIDLIWNGYTITDARKEQVLFSNPYLKNEQVIVIRKDDSAKYKSSSDLSGKSLVVQQGSSAKDAIDENNSLKNNTITELKENATILLELSQKNHEAAVMDSVVANFYIKNGRNDLMILDEVLADEQYGIGMRKEDTELCQKINAALKAMYENNKLKEIAGTYGIENLLLRDEILKG